MDERVGPELREAERQVRRALLHDDNADMLIDCIQRATDALDRARQWAVPPARKVKAKKGEEVVPAELGTQD